MSVNGFSAAIVISDAEQPDKADLTTSRRWKAFPGYLQGNGSYRAASQPPLDGLEPDLLSPKEDAL